MTEKDYLEVLKRNLDEKRYHHSLCVASSARELAKKYGADVEKAYLCGLLHDVTKQLKSEIQLQIIEKSDIIKVESTQGIEKIYHSKSGAAYVHDALGINDPEIIEAISCHTTAKPGMSRLETVLYIADFISSDRDYPDVEVMRILAREDLLQAVKYSLAYTVGDLVARRLSVHTDTFAAYNSYIAAGTLGW